MRLAPLIATLVLLVWASPVASATGGAPAPGPEGGYAYGQPARAPLTVARFSVRPRELRPGTPTRVTYRLTGPRRRVRVCIELTARERQAARAPNRAGDPAGGCHADVRVDAAAG